MPIIFYQNLTLLINCMYALRLGSLVMCCGVGVSELYRVSYLEPRANRLLFPLELCTPLCFVLLCKVHRCMCMKCRPPYKIMFANVLSVMVLDFHGLLITVHTLIQTV